MTTTDKSKYRPDEEFRWTNDRTEPVTIDVRTKWLYSEPQKEGERYWAFSRDGEVVRSDVPTEYDHMDDINSHVHRAVMAFGDDADIEIIVRRKGA